MGGRLQGGRSILKGRPCRLKTATLGGRPARRYSDKEMKLDKRNALITGASAGIGREFARQLAGRARSLILVARREDRLSEVRDKLTQQRPTLTVHIRSTDLANLSEVEELTTWLKQENIHVDLLINNAGLGDSGPFAASDLRRN